MVKEVKRRRKYLNSGDVFILDLGLELYQARVCVCMCVLVLIPYANVYTEQKIKFPCCSAINFVVIIII